MTASLLRQPAAGVQFGGRLAQGAGKAVKAVARRAPDGKDGQRVAEAELFGQQMGVWHMASWP
ncbi:hypothetical protein ABZX77_37545 [Streptomyces sp. NPDC004237]|uniref:hypothetical protein n=1 Tax=Streptomyces sp. NPDC004237 TaxID=3154455 RepID=UPI0033B9AB8E